MKSVNSSGRKIKTTHFPISLIFIYLGVFLLMSGVHMGLLVGMNRLGVSPSVQPIVPILYWLIMGVIFTVFTRYKMKKTYENPMKMLAEATSQVAAGDFSVYVPPIHTPDKQDYIDVMIEDFNHMVEELGTIETLKTDFFSSVSHEIKTPIAVIQNAATMLKNENLPAEKQQEYINTINSASRRLSSLITNILKLNRLEKQVIIPEKEVYDLPAQLADCALQFENQWEERDIEFDADLEDAALIFADPALMELLWTNLISNALKFTEKGGKVSVAQKHENGNAVVEISDTGCGMDEETVKHIFDKFYQGDSSHSTEGNGLGLALVWRICQLMDTKISVKSKPGEGSVFTVIIPLAGSSDEVSGS